MIYDLQKCKHNTTDFQNFVRYFFTAFIFRKYTIYSDCSEGQNFKMYIKINLARNILHSSENQTFV